jgi:hypothetical protein
MVTAAFPHILPEFPSSYHPTLQQHITPVTDSAVKYIIYINTVTFNSSSFRNGWTRQQTFYFTSHVVRILTKDSSIAFDTSRDAEYLCCHGLCRFRTISMSASYRVGVPARPSFSICLPFNRITHHRGQRGRYGDYATGWMRDRGTWFDSWWEGEDILLPRVHICSGNHPASFGCSRLLPVEWNGRDMKVTTHVHLVPGYEWG